MNSNDPADFRAARLVSSYTQTIDAPPHVVFPLLCPVREAEWVEGWVGWPLFARTGVAEHDGVYATRHGREESPTIWVITKHDPVDHFIEFVTFVPGCQVFRLTISLQCLGSAQSEVRITYVRTATTLRGNAALTMLRESNGDQAMMQAWELDMNHFLNTGHVRLASG